MSLQIFIHAKLTTDSQKQINFYNLKLFIFEPYSFSAPLAVDSRPMQKGGRIRPPFKLFLLFKYIPDLAGNKGDKTPEFER